MTYSYWGQRTHSTIFTIPQLLQAIIVTVEKFGHRIESGLIIVEETSNLANTKLKFAPFQKSKGTIASSSENSGFIMS